MRSAATVGRLARNADAGAEFCLVRTVYHRASLGIEFFIIGDRNYYLDRLYPGFWHQIYPRSSQTLLPQTPLVNRLLIADSSVANLSDYANYPAFAIGSCGARIAVVAIDDRD